MNQYSRNTSIGTTVKSNDNQPCPYECMHHAESMHVNINDVDVQDKILEGLQPVLAEERDID